MFGRKSIIHNFSVLFVVVFMLAATSLQKAQAADVRYAKPAVSGTGNCLSWANACTLQTAITGATDGDEIWVASGIYKPTTDGAERAATFQLIEGVAVYGGFAGVETARDERNPVANVTILSGDIDNNDSQTPIITDLSTVTGNTTNSYHVVTGATGYDVVTMDGFTITAGSANGGSDPNNRGGGMYNLNNSPVLTNVTFSGNSATYGGGGMFNQYSDSPTLTNVTFSHNSATYGGGMYNEASNPTLTNVTFSGNSATYGGGIYNTNYGSLILRNVTFSGNSTTYGGGIYSDAINGTTSQLYSVTFSGNSATSSGGGLYNYSSLSIRNAIFWGNTAAAGAQVYQYPNIGSIPVNDSVVQDGCPDRTSCTNIITTDPLLGSLGDYGGSTQTIPLLAGSSAIDTGYDALCPATDQRGVTRPLGAHCDIGAYEAQTILLAVAGGQTSGLCEKWGTACELSYALGSAVSGQEIWVAAGTYKPTAGTDRTATFQLKSGVAIYGGFLGMETARDQRNPVANVTILSGDIDNNDTQRPIITDLTTVTGNTTNSYNVVTGATGATLDGFTITAGNANFNNVFSPNGNGGGMYNENSSPTLTNLTFSGNSALYYGGGMLNNNSSSPTLTNLTFSGNSAGSDGGGMFNWNSSSPTLTNLTFSGNSAVIGGGMYNYTTSNPTLTNVTFTNNSATTLHGGGMYNENSSPTLTNVTFSGNRANNSGGGMYNKGGSNPQIRNTIFWGNTASGGAQIFDFNSAPVVSDSVVQGGYAGTNIITADPLLGALGNYGGSTQTIPILAGSSAIDTGNDVTCATTDQRGIARPQGAHCDIGAFEQDDFTTPVVNTFTVTTPSTSLNIPITAFIASDAAGVTGYLITASATAPAAGAGGWTGSAPTTHTVASDGSYTLYPWAKDAVGNVSAVFASPRTVVADTTAPAVDTFTVTTPSNSLNIPITSFTASDTVGVTGYLITTSDTAPEAGAAGWTGTAPTTYTVVSDGSYTLYPWAKDAVGNVSAVFASPRAVVVDTTMPTVTSIIRANPSPTNLASMNFTVTFSESVTGVAAGDFALTKTGTISGESVTGVSGGPTIYTVTVNRDSGNGTLRLDIPTSATIADQAGNPLAGLPYTSGETYTVEEKLTGNWIYLPQIRR